LRPFCFDAEPLEDPIADAVAMLRVDVGQIIDVEEDHRNGIAEPTRALDFLGKDGREQRGLEDGPPRHRQAPRGY
jgi:hypothetical protein